ncbi:hypothetical protein EU546_08000 [Candidatus Thorarchaeota archaeon]|nr:MAG: hypothetical protein EU546_08000 [Candidatus Thorarchaeota archaeon]
MIKKILARILEGGMVDKKTVAREVGIQPETLDDIIRLLIERGYLEVEGEGCEVSTACSSCDARSSCQVVTDNRAYHVTERGAQYVQGESG